MAKRCVCCDLPEESCGKRIELEGRAQVANERSQRLTEPGWFAANYDGTCTRCGERFKEGDPICRDREADRGYRCCDLPTFI